MLLLLVAGFWFELVLSLVFFYPEIVHIQRKSPKLVIKPILTNHRLVVKHILRPDMQEFLQGHRWKKYIVIS